MFIDDFPIYAANIQLRKIELKDSEAIYSYRSLEEIALYQYWEPFTMDDALSFLEANSRKIAYKKGEWIGLIIEKDKEVIGDCAFKIEGNFAEIGCNISPVFQGKGFAKESLKLLISYLFDNYEIQEVVAITDSENIASINLMKSLGLQKDNNFHNELLCKGRLSIEHRYSIKKDKCNTF